MKSDHQFDGVVERLRRGARDADVGCGHGASTILMARAFPNSTSLGSDYHVDSIDTARRRAAEAGVAGHARFEVAAADAYTGERYELVTMFDCQVVADAGFTRFRRVAGTPFNDVYEARP